MKVYGITQRSLAPHHGLAVTVRRWAESGVDLAQVREKDLGAREVYEIVRRILDAPLPERFELFVNERFDVALAAGAHGVHLGVRSLPVKLVRRRVGRRLRIGYSAHSVAEALQAERDGADLVTLSPVFPPHSKPASAPALGVEPLRQAARRLRRAELFALGGLDPGRARLLRGTGVAGIALTGNLMTSTDPTATVRSLRAALQEN